MSKGKKKSTPKKKQPKKTAEQPVFNVAENPDENTLQNKQINETKENQEKKHLYKATFPIETNENKTENRMFFNVSADESETKEEKLVYKVNENVISTDSEEIKPAKNKKTSHKPKKNVQKEETDKNTVSTTEKKKPGRKKNVKEETEKTQPAKKTSRKGRKKKVEEEKPAFVITDYSLKNQIEPVFDRSFVAVVLCFTVLLAFLISSIEISQPEYEKRELQEVFENKVNKLVISEICSSNNGIYADEDGNVADFIELYNGTDKDINLKGYGLSDRKDKFKFVFDDTVIKAGQYLTVSLCGTDNPDTLQAGFKLSSAGKEKVILVSDNLVVIDSVKTVALSAGNTMAIDEKGHWYISCYATPGYENSKKGYEGYLDSLNCQNENEIIINEFLPANRGNYLSESDYGFIELKNISDHDISLADYFISDDLARPFRRKLDDTLLQPGQLYVLSFNSNDRNYSYAGFNADKKTGVLTIAKKSGIVSRLEYNNLPNGLAYQYSEGRYYLDGTVSIGQQNDAEGIRSFQQTMLKPETLLINEIMKDDSRYLKIADEYYDWIELYNNSLEAVNLADYYLSDSRNDLYLCRLPEITLNPGQYYTVICTSADFADSRYFNTGFRLSDYSGIYLSDMNGIIDSVFIEKLPFGYSYGRFDDYGFGFISKPTLNKANAAAVAAVSHTPQISQKSGVYNNVESLKLSIEADGDIYYTLDGNTPDSSSKKYNGEITLSETTVVKAVCYQKGKVKSEVATSSYIINENNTLPVLSMSMDSKLFDSINRNYRAEDYRLQGFVEYFDLNGDGFSQKCGVGLFGDDSRSFRKKNYVFKFTKEFGGDSIHYPVFESRENADYSTLSIRAGGQDWTDSIFRDHLMTELVDEYTDILTFASKTIVVYINGNYWGLYTLREKKSGSFFEDNYNINPDSLNLMLSCGEVERGSSKDYVQLRNYVRTHNLANDQYYNYVCEHIDVVQWADFWIAHCYCANVDCFNIRYYSSPELNDGKWMCLFYDLDWGMSSTYGPDYNFYSHYLFSSQFPCYWVKDGERTIGIENDIIRNLFKNKNFRQLWLQRLKYNLENTWNRDIVLAKIDKLQAEYETEIVRNQNRWDHSVSHWKSSVEQLRHFVKYRQYYLLRQTKSYFNMTDAQMKEFFGDLYK